MRTGLFVGIGGFFGAIARYVVAGMVSKVDEHLPWGTLVVNLSGSFVLGMLLGAMANHFAAHSDLRIALTVGFVGAYTTFSTFVFETYEFVEAGDIAGAAWTLLISFAGGLLAVWAGLAVGRAI